MKAKKAFLIGLLLWLPFISIAEIITQQANSNGITRETYNFQGGTETVNVTSSLLFYDNGGPNGEYTTEAQGTVRFVPNDGDIIKLVFNSFSTHYADYMYVYSGNSTDLSDRLAKISGYKTSSNLPEDILSIADDGSITIKFEPKKSNTNDGWEIQVISHTPTPLIVSDVSTSALSTEKLLRGAQNEQMLKVAVTLTGERGTYNFNKFVFTTNSEAETEITNAKLYYSHINDVQSNTIYANEAYQAPFTFNGTTQIKQPGTYYFWLTYDIATNATIGTNVSATLQSIEDSVAGNITINQSVTATRTIQAGFSGTYSIGPSAGSNYKTFSSAISAMSGGIDGEVVFKIESGTYSEAVTIPHIAGASAENTITIKSATNNYNDVIIERSNYSNGLFTFNGADHITLEGITVRTSGATNDPLISVKNISNHVTVRNCFIQAPCETSYSGVSLVRTDAENTPYANSDYFTLENSVLDGGRVGVYIYGTGYVALPKQKGARITGNTFTNQGFMSVYVTKEHDGIVENNTITVNGAYGNEYKGIDAVMVGNTIVRNNKITVSDVTSNTSIYAIYPRRRDDDETLEGRNRIYNNQVIIAANNVARPTYGIYSYKEAITNTDIVYNSINITNETEKQNCAPFCIWNNAGYNPENVTLENNVFQNNAGGSVYHINRADALEGLTFSNNALFTTGTLFAYAGSDIANFEAWQTVSNETNSIVEQVQFLAPNSLDLAEVGNLQAAKPLSFVTTDINGTPRHSVTPTMGAYEYVSVVMPEMAEGYPKVENITHQSAVVKAKLTENGKLFVLTRKTSETAPTQAEVLSGTEKDMLKNVEEIIEISGLEILTEYKTYCVIQSLSEENSDIISSEPFTTLFLPTQVSTFEDIPLGTEGEFVDGTASFVGFKVVEIEDGQKSGNTRAAKLQNNGTITITNNNNGLILNGFLFKSDISVTLKTKQGETETNTANLDPTGGKWVFINLKNMGEITSVILSGTGNTLIDNFSGTPHPMTLSIDNQTVSAGETVTIVPDINGGALPYSYVWKNSNHETISEEATLSLTATNTAEYTLKVTDAWGDSITANFTVTVTGSSEVATFDDLYLEPESYYWGDPEQTTSVFYSGSYSFSNTLMANLNSWAGFAYSNKTSTTFVNISDQFNSAVGHGVNNSENYAVAFTMGDPTKVTLTNSTDGDTVSGCYVTNNAWVVYVSENGTGMGDEPNAPFHEGDWFKVIATADNGNKAEFYLADYRSTNANHHYTLESWQWFDLRSLGQVKHIRFSTDGTRHDMFGPTIPSYFCMDDFGGERNILTASEKTVKEYDTININLTSLFDSLNFPTDFSIYTITDAPDEELASATINENTLQLIGNQRGNTSLIIRQTIKGESVFVKIPIVVTFNNSVENDMQKTEIKVSPNPANESITINAGGDIRIYSIDGNLVKTINNYQPNQYIDISKLNSGLYILKVNNQGTISIHKLIKK